LTFPNFAPRKTPLSDEDAFEAMKAAIDGGSTFWNGGVFYGFGPKGEALNLELVGRFFTKYPQLADKVFLSVKGGFNPSKGPDGDPEFLRSDLDRILKALDGKKKLNMYEMARVDQSRYYDLSIGKILIIDLLKKSFRLYLVSLKRESSIISDYPRPLQRLFVKQLASIPSQLSKLNSLFGQLISRRTVS